MLKLVLFFVSFSLALSCPDGYDLLLSGHCFKLASKSSESYSDAKKLCKDNGGQLPSLHSYEESAQLYAIVHSLHKIDKYWLGLECDQSTDHKDAWVDGTPVDYTPHHLEDCHFFDRFYLQNAAHEWTSPMMPFNFAPVICQAKNTEVHECDDFSPMGHSDCVQAMPTLARWSDAQELCKQQQSSLVSIHNQQENDFVRRTIVAYGFTAGAHIGLHSNHQQFASSNYSWIDNSTLDYTNFASGFPNDVYGDSFGMAADGFWRNVDPYQKLPSVCERPMFDYSQPPRALPCPTDNFFTPGWHVFSPGYPRPARTNGLCEYTLSAPGQRIKIEIMALQLNRCCDWLEIFDGEDILMQTLTGEVPAGTTFSATSSTMTLRYNASSGVSVRGFHIKVDTQ